ncbi:MAG: ROK family protein [Candidatus Nanoarchaeia archaeon]
MKVIGLDIGGTKIKAGLVEGSRVIKKIEVETKASQGRDKVVQKITRLVDLLNDKSVKGIGVGFPGMVDVKKGIVIRSPHIKCLNGFNIKKHLQKKFRKKVIISNEVKAATLAEAKYGAGVGHKNFVFITLGTGIGGGVIADGKMWCGKGNAVEIGHMTINFDGIKSTCCNNYGCFEEYASARAIQRTFGKKINPKTIAELAEKGNKKAKEAYKEFGKHLGVGLVNIANSFDPEVIIIGGGLAKSWNLFQKEMIKTIRQREFVKTKIAKTKLEDGGIIGAALLLKGIKK